MQINTNIDLDMEDFALSMTHEQAFEAIKIIDKEQVDWDFTLEAAKYFIAEILKLDEPEHTSELYVLLHNGV